MSNYNSMNFIDTYLAWIRNNSSQVKVGDYEEITTPFVDSHNDHIQFYVTRSPNGYVLTDDGYIINDLLMCGCDVKSKKRKEMISQLAESLGVSIIGDSIQVEATESDIARKQHVIIQAMLKIGDLFMTSASRIKGLFTEEVEAFFSDNDIRNTPSIMMMGQSGLTHRFDFVIPASRKMPERVLTTINSPSKQSVQAAIFAWNDIAKVRSSRTKGYIVLNDGKRAINADLLSAIGSYNLTPIQWKNRNNFIEELVS